MRMNNFIGWILLVVTGIGFSASGFAQGRGDRNALWRMEKRLATCEERLAELEAEGSNGYPMGYRYYCTVGGTSNYSLFEGYGYTRREAEDNAVANCQRTGMSIGHCIFNKNCNTL